jgi:hypothetical protein
MVAYMTLLLEFTKILIWPLLIAGVIIFYREEFRGLFRRLKKAGLDGVELNDEAEKQLEQKPDRVGVTDSESQVSLSEIEGFSRSIAIEGLSKRIKKDFLEIKDKKSFTEEKSLDFLIDRISIERLLRHFDNVYNLIFGSQISSVYRIKGAGMRRDGLREIYKTAVANDPEFYATYSFEQWLSFMIESHLIEDINGTLSITPVGVDFLQYILSNSLSLAKRG